MLNEKPGGTTEALLTAALACFEAARTLRRPVLWDIDQVWARKNLMPPGELLARVDELKVAAGKEAAACETLLGPFRTKLAAQHDKPVKVGRVTASSWHEAAVRVARKVAGWHLGTGEIKAYFKSLLDPKSRQLRPRKSEPGVIPVEVELRHLMAAVEHEGDHVEATLQIEAAKLAKAGVDAWTQATPLQRRVIAALWKSGRPMKGDAIARAMGREPCGSLRDAYSHMQQLGWIRSGPEGYEPSV